MKRLTVNTGFLTLLLLILLSCEKQTSWELQKGERYPVVDCILTNELKIQELTVYWSALGMNEIPQPISGAYIELFDENSSVLFSEDTNKAGRYISSQSFRAAAGYTYRLVVACNGISDTAEAEMVAINPLEPLKIVVYDSLYRFEYTESQRPSMTEIYYNWSADGNYCEKYGACSASETFYTLENIDVGKLFPPDKQVIAFPRNTEIIRKKYSLSEEHQEFLRSLLLETEWRGGLFDIEQDNVPTNFHHGIRGWFAACMVLSDTTFFK
jgi:hypothetical protein